jgi:uncharacterized protein YjbJ (UPF0337 family)
MSVRWRTPSPLRAATGFASRSPRSNESARCVRHRTYRCNPVADTGVVVLSACRPFTGIRFEEQVMSINKDQVKGRVEEAEGKIKEIAGKFTGNETLELKGKVQKGQGEAQAAFGDLKKNVEDAVKKA